ncbi:unnamed protein product [Sphagnum troendelagicum]|uniref:Arabinogalactan-like protein n=1 Tax=Sphagnum troendelagicum TaxID=128251 RepID=A0ABP0TDA4_9BRYO
MQAAMAVMTLLNSMCVSATQGLSPIGSPSTSPSPANSAPISFTGAPAPSRFLHGPTATPTPAASTGKTPFLAPSTGPSTTVSSPLSSPRASGIPSGSPAQSPGQNGGSLTLPSVMTALAFSVLGYVVVAVM